MGGLFFGGIENTVGGVINIIKQLGAMDLVGAWQTVQSEPVSGLALAVAATVILGVGLKKYFWVGEE